MPLIDWSDPEAMLALLMESIQDEFSGSHRDARRSRFLAELIERLVDLEARFSALPDTDRAAALREMVATVDPEFARDPVVEHLADCAAEIERIGG